MTLGIASALSTVLLGAGLVAHFVPGTRQWSAPLVQGGLGLLIAMPAARVVAAGALFLAARRWFDAALAAAVLAILAAGVWIAMG